MTKKKSIRLNRLITVTNDVAPRGEGSIATPRACPVACAPTPMIMDAPDAGEPGLLRPGQDVKVGALVGNSVMVKSQRRMKPGTRTDLQLIEQLRTLSGEVDRCRVIALEPLWYEAIFVFHQDPPGHRNG